MRESRDSNGAIWLVSSKGLVVEVTVVTLFWAGVGGMWLSPPSSTLPGVSMTTGMGERRENTQLVSWN